MPKGGMFKRQGQKHKAVGAMSTVGSAKSKSTVRSNASSQGTAGSSKSPYIGQTPRYNRTYRSISDAWWSVGEYMRPGITHQSVGLSLKGAGLIGQPEDTDTWDLSDSLADMYDKVMREMRQNMPTKKTNGDKSIDVRAWLEKDTSNGFIRVFIPDSDLSKSYLIPLTLNTPAGRVCQILGIPPNSLHVQLNGDIIQRLEPYENPLVIQNEYLATIGYTDVTRIQEEGHNPEIGFQIRFYTGKPFHDGTYSRNQLQAWVEVRKGKVLHQWARRLCIISGTRLYIYRDKERRNTPTVVQLAKGSVEEVSIKGHERCLKLTSTIQGEKSVFLSFSSESQYAKWRKKCKKATSKLPTSADLSNNHLEFLPENLFINEELTMLNLRHNVLKERPIEDDIYTIGWLDDLPRFRHLRSLNLADNNLGVIPTSIYLIKTLVELNVASNKLEDIPSQISNLCNLQALHIHNNHLTSLPEEMVTLKKLFILVLAFNKFPVIPSTVAIMTNVRMTEVENLIMAGNYVERLSGELLDKMKYVKKVDLRMNRLTLPPSETTKFHLLEQLTHLDIRDNKVADLDIRSVRTLEYLNCERNKMTTLQVNGASLKNLFAAHNDIHYLYITPKPEWLVTLDVSHNKLKALPEWLPDCFFLQKLQASYNRITTLPPRIFLDSKKLKFLWVDHNELEQLPQDVDAFYVEELHVENNKIRLLPADFLRNANKLRVFNATSNKLTSLPDLSPVQDLNKIQELYLSGNFLQDESFTTLCGYQRLKCLHIAHNDIYEIFERDVSRLQALQELNISENKLKFLPDAITRLPDLRVLRAHSNMLRYLPDFGRSSNLKVLDVGLNRLLDTSVTDLMSSQIDLLDMSCNTQMRVDMKELQSVRRYKDINMIDMTGQNRTLPGLDNRGRTSGGDDPCPWNLGFSETSGIRNKLCVASIKMAKYDEGQALLGVFDGGLNNEVPKILADRIPDLIRRERYEKENRDEYMKYTFLTAHRELRHKGQRLGASGAVCHIRRLFENRDRYKLEVANAGDVSIVMSRGGEAVCLTKLHTIEDSPDECQRICKSDGIITEDNKVNGVCNCTKQLGCSYLFPHIIPDPHTERITLKPEDQCLIIANRGLWQYVSYQEAVWEVESLSNPVMAAKRLQDLAQSYGSRENICILGKPFHDGTYSRNQLQAWVEVRKGKVLHQWARRLCIISGTRLYIYRDKERRNTPTVVQLAKGSVEEVCIKGHERCLKLTSTIQGEKSVFLSFSSESQYAKWRKKCKKATSKLPTSADLSNNHLEFLPENLFINEELTMLNLRHNVLKERPIEDDIYTIGWLDDLPRFRHLRSLNLADNNLGVIPTSIYLIKTLVELNVASNKLEDIPSQISNLCNLQALHIHNNHLTSLPEEMVTLKKLFILVLAFNKFPVIPNTVAMMTNVRMTEVENLIMAGNYVERLSGELLDKLKYVKKVDLRMNRLTLPPSETTKFHLLEQLTHLDIRDNKVADLDIRSVRTLEYLNCERNKMTTLQVNGASLKNLFAAHNDIHYLYITPKPEWLVTLDVSHNKLKALPEWLPDCFFLQKLQASYNRITTLPPRIFLDSKKLKFLWVDHNELEQLPQDVDAFYVEELHVENNKIRLLPADFLRNANKLRVFNATSNKLTSLPDLSPVQDLNKIQELYLSGNFLQDESFTTLCGYQRLKCLHIAHNDIYEIFERDVSRLQALQELNISENKLKFLPDAITRLPDLRVLRAHSNMLRYLPDFGRSSNLKVLDVGLNRLLDTSVTDLMSSQIDLLDMSCNTQMRVDMKELQSVRRYKDINMIDMTGQNRTLPGLDNRGRTSGGDDPCPWNLGFSETSGIRNKLCVASIKMAKYDEGQALLGVFDGGLNNEVPKILADRIPDLIRRERYEKENRDEYMKYTFLTAHRELRHKGQRLGASGAVCHIRRLFENRDRYKLEVANAGDVSIVMSRGGEAVCLTKLHTIEDSPDECQRICKSDGIITEDNKVNGVCNCTKQLGCSYLFPHIIPDPHTERITLKPEDQCLIIANRGLWQYVSYQEAVWEVESLSNPVMAAKRLQDLAQSYGSRENICILVLKLFIPELELQRDILSPLRLELQNLREGIDVDNESDRQSDVSSQDSARCTGPETEPEDVDIVDNRRRRVRSPRRNRPAASDVQVRPLPGHRYRRRDDAEEWASIIQQRLSEEVKDKELKYSVADIAIAIEEVETQLPRKETKKPSLRDVENWLTSREPVPWERSDSQQLVMPSEVVRREQKKKAESITDTESTLLRPSQIKKSTRLKDSRRQYNTLPVSRSKGMANDDSALSDHSSKLSGMIKATPRKHKAKTIHGLRGGKYKTEAASYLTTCIKRRQGQEIASILSELVKTDHPDKQTQGESTEETRDSGKTQNKLHDNVQTIFHSETDSQLPESSDAKLKGAQSDTWNETLGSGYDNEVYSTDASTSDRDRRVSDSRFVYEEIHLDRTHDMNARSDSESSFAPPSQSPVDTSSVVDHPATQVVEVEVHNDDPESLEVPRVRLRRRNIPMGSFGRAAAARARMRTNGSNDRPISDGSDDVQSMTTAGSFEAIYSSVDQHSQTDSYSSETVTISNLSDSAKETDIDSLYAKVRKGSKTPALEGWEDPSDRVSAIYLDDTLRDSESIESIIITHL
ncbi:uncharacterized protein LOC106158698 [Lingula anatina]|uniref:Uncharacterized protein LOC106158698 n=1 Tax=Lingula anatina TaxID=7574 RepID=A0A1S3HXD8_LINAN|nr:uncharacterized protein LOC106158698 [Lingula anatina]|eukprot:XP_013390226.1 uncharacterized protein LOC106158698 [Lingula anatina]